LSNASLCGASKGWVILKPLADPFAGKTHASPIFVCSNTMTERLYYENSYLREFVAKCIGVTTTAAGFAVVLDQTAFYPTSGGQPHDLGLIHGIRVEDVHETDHGVIIHSMVQPVETGAVKCLIDWTRRFDHMQQHTGQHILSQAFLRTSQLDTLSFHMGVTYATIDLNAETISNDQLRRAEDLANDVVRENRLIKVKIIQPQEAAGLSLRKESRREGPLRIVEVDEFDVSACGGTHVKQTGEVREIVVRNIERVNRQVRVEFVCGRRALESHRSALLSLNVIANKLSVGRNEAVERLEKQIDELKQLRKLLQQKSRSLALFAAQEAYAEAPEHHGIKLVKRIFEQEDFDFLKLVAQHLLSRGPSVALLGNRGTQAQVVLARTDSVKLDLRGLLNECCELIEGKGGGAANLVQGGGKRTDQIEAALDRAEQRVIAALAQQLF
jgi:alanyl-tRNA synthetase